MKHVRRWMAGLLAFVMVFLVLPVVSLPVLAEEECTAEDYDALIIQNGLKLWLDASGEYAPDLATGVWKSRVGEGEAILDGVWRNTSDGGITYSILSVADGSQSCKLHKADLLFA